MNKTKHIIYGGVDIGKPHFTLYYRPKDDTDCYHVAVLAAANTVEDLMVELLDECLPEDVINLLERTVAYFLYNLNPQASLKEKIGYLIYFCTTVSNHYGQIVFGYVPNITSINILYYIKTRSRLIGIHDCSLINDLLDVYLQMVTNKLFDEALGKTDQSCVVTEYNNNLTYLYKILFTNLPNQGGFTLHNIFNLVEFSKWLSVLSIQNYSLILNFILYVNLIKKKIY